MKLWDRIKAWAVGPGWLADSNLDAAYYAAVDAELDAKEAIEQWTAYWDAMIDDEQKIEPEETA